LSKEKIYKAYYTISQNNDIVFTGYMTHEKAWFMVAKLGNARAVFQIKEIK